MLDRQFLASTIETMHDSLHSERRFNKVFLNLVDKINKQVENKQLNDIIYNNTSQIGAGSYYLVSRLLQKEVRDDEIAHIFDVSQSDIKKSFEHVCSAIGIDYSRIL